MLIRPETGDGRPETKDGRQETMDDKRSDDPTFRRPTLKQKNEK